jgi:hypothetical protein
LNLEGFFGFIVLAIALGLIAILTVAGRSRPGRQFREISAFTRLRRSVGLAVEAGTRMHVSLGRGEVTGIEAGSVLVGLAMQERIARAASVSDRPPVSTTGNGTIGMLSQETYLGVYRSLGAETQFSATRGRVTGLTPFSYAVGTMPVIHDEQVSANLLLGHMGAEALLINEAAERTGSLTVAGTDHLPGQAVLYAAAQEPLIGEEVFAGGAYLGAGPTHEASLRAQDILRVLIIAFILLAVVLRFLGLDEILQSLISAVSP